MRRDCWLLIISVIVLVPTLTYSKKVKTAVFLSPEFVLGPGSVANKFFYNIDFPRGHIALKSFNAEVVDEAGNSVPLDETYIHHWIVERYHRRKDAAGTSESDCMKVRNDGICQRNRLGQYFGLGSETRRTSTRIPDPYGLQVGDPADVPNGYEELWMLNVHAIDTRGAEDSLGCNECRCDLYNVTMDEHGSPLNPDYNGGLHCCYDQTQCRIKQGFQDHRRSLYLRYTVKWLDWDGSILPARVYILDATDTWTKSNPVHNCKVEYEVDSWNTDDANTHYQRATIALPTRGHVVYGVAHQHSGGIGCTVYREDGEAICSSVPIYGDGKEAGNEDGYIVGMSTCYPSLGTAEISDGEILILESRYSRSSSRNHTGVMGIFYLLVADQLPQSKPTLNSLVQADVAVAPSTFLYVAAALVAVALAAGIVVGKLLKRYRDDGYEALVM